ncbi:MAG: hypothetical protein KGL48_17560 [Sphingomonadales bacterium]|nr:hypothetical protein [Sphingomonadales bacterium]MDE2570688.1 hypothetical protein [Sphingomonadales bacterium]
MRKAILAITATMLAGAAPPGAGPDPGDGYLSGPALPGFVIGFSDGNARGAIVEQVPQDETVEKWTRMITTQRFTGLATTTKPVDYLQYMARSLPQSCRGAAAGTPRVTTVSGRPAAEMRADCPSNPQTHLPETFLILAVAGPRDMHVKQVAWRYVPSPEDVEWGENYLGSTGFCLPLSKDPACRLVAPD